MRKPIAIGEEFYKDMIRKNSYYVDKTLLIRDILDSGAKVSLFTRPRRFGKTLALNMLKTYFEDERDEKGEKIDNSHYFDGMKIMSCGERYTEKIGQYPVINLSLKSAKQPSYEMAYAVLKQELVREYGRYLYILQGDVLNENEKEIYRTIYCGRAEAEAYATALKFLSECLQKYFRKNVIILIDEYDVPLENAYFEGFYDRMIAFIRSLFESALKINPNLEFAVITGCLRISYESIFTGLNNLRLISIVGNDFAEYFGFTQEETKQMLIDYGMEKQTGEVKDWYDGYRFGDTEVYNPWSVINYVNDNYKKQGFPRPYWSNTSSNQIIRELVEKADFVTKKEIEELIAGGTIEKPIHEDITYGDIHESQDNLWNFLFFTGYLKKAAERKEEETVYISMTIPNAEIRYIYRNTILTWFDKQIRQTDLSPLRHAVEAGDCEAFADFLSEQLQETISFYDYAESYYHGFLAGILKGVGRYEIVSNRESGTGRPDLMMKPPTVRKRAFILELKVAKEYRGMEAECDGALAQCRRENYAAALLQEGYSEITLYGICFYRKECLVKKLEISGT